MKTMSANGSIPRLDDWLPQAARHGCALGRRTAPETTGTGPWNAGENLPNARISRLAGTGALTRKDSSTPTSA